MFTYECLLAAALVTAPPDHLSQHDTLSWFEPLRCSVVAFGIQAETLDARETRNRFQSSCSFHDDLNLLQMRFQDLLHAPLVEECRRFPERAMVIEFLDFNRAYRQDLVVQIALAPVRAEELRDALLETDQLYRIWETVRDARCEYYYVHVRRHALQQLRNLLGEHAFYRGELPPSVPILRLPELK